MSEVRIDCASRLSMCHARCCRFDVLLTVDERRNERLGRDPARPTHLERSTADGYCVHNAVESFTCLIHGERPGVCRRYDCRDDKRIWIDFDARIPAPSSAPPRQRPVG